MKQENKSFGVGEGPAWNTDKALTGGEEDALSEKEDDMHLKSGRGQ